MAPRRRMVDPVARSLAQAAEGCSAVSMPVTDDDPLSAARGILYATVGGAAVWAAMLGGAVAVIQRLR